MNRMSFKLKLGMMVCFCLFICLTLAFTGTINISNASDNAAMITTASRTRLIWWSLLFIAFFLVVYRNLLLKQRLAFSKSESNIVFIALLCVAAFLRLLIAPSIIGFSSDIVSFVAWSQDVAQNGISHFYGHPDKLADYPPGYMYVLYILAKWAHAIGIEYPSQGTLILYKLPAMLADLVCTYLIFSVSRKYIAPAAAIALAALYAFNPAIILNSAAWGQIDSFFMLFILLAIMMLVKGKVPLSTALFALAVLIKPQALMFGPLLLFVFIRIRQDIKTIALSVVAGLLVIVLVPLPFMIHQIHGPLSIIDLYKNTLGSYNYATLNAYNLIALVGGNWQPVSNKILFISYTMWSYFLIAASLVYCGFLYFKSKANDAKLYWIAFFFMTAVFMVMVKMHERYLFYALLPGLMSCIYFKDRRILLLFFGFSLTHFFNTDEVLANNIANIVTFNRHGVLLVITSLANTLLFIYMIKVSWDILIRNKLQPFAEIKPKSTSRNKGRLGHKERTGK